MVVCIQAEFGALQAIRLHLPFAESLGRRCKAAVTREEFRESLNQACDQLNAFPAFPGANTVSAHQEFQDDDFIMRSLAHLYEALRNSKPSRFSAGRGGSVSFRLPAISLRTPENLEFWTGSLEKCARLQVPYLAIASNGRLPVDLIVGEPTPKDLFCLRAKETALPLTRTESRSRHAANFEPVAKEYLELFKAGPGADTGRRRSWWPGQFGRLV